MEVKNFIEQIADVVFDIRKQTDDRDPWRVFDLPKDLQQSAIALLGAQNQHAQSVNWLNAIFQDVMLRHISFNSKKEDEIEKVVEQVGSYLYSGKVELHTIIPVVGLGAEIFFGEELYITETVRLRRIPHWEWNWISRILRQETYVANFCLESITRIEPDQIDWKIDYDEISRSTKLILGNLQMIQPMGMSTPWIIQYVPICQFMVNRGHISSANILLIPGERSYYPYQRNQIELCANRIELLQTLDQTFQRRTEIALLRYQDATNRLNWIDAVMDYWIALEALLGGKDTKYGTARKLSAKIAVLLYEDKEEQYDLMKWLANSSYKCRNRIAHGGLVNINDLFEIDTKMSEVTQSCIEKVLEKQESYETLKQKMKPDVEYLVTKYQIEFGQKK